MWLESAEKRRCSLTMQLQFDSQIFMSIVFLCFVGLLCYLYSSFVEKPNRLRSKLMKQGISGPPSTILLGNILELQKARSATSKSSSSSSKVPSSHNCAALLLPLFDKWTNEYGILICTLIFQIVWVIWESPFFNYLVWTGQVFMFSLGTIQILCVNQPDIVREVTVCTSLDLGKPAYQLKHIGPLVGQGILTSNGTKWVHQRKILAPELYMEKVKVYI